MSTRTSRRLPDVIQSLEESMEKEEQQNKLMHVREKLDAFTQVKFQFSLKNNLRVETFLTSTELPLRELTRCAPLADPVNGYIGLWTPKNSLLSL
ncbi:hypothetical protein C0J52_21558 [Blattella germanica]|nr:hypothetical protein C0J52_21558 [Blattella germanica]